MIVKETVTRNGRELIRTYSDEGRYVVRDGEVYVKAIDPPEFDREYTEGEVIGGEDDASEDDYIAALGEFGVKA